MQQTKQKKEGVRYYRFSQRYLRFEVKNVDKYNWYWVANAISSKQYFKISILGSDYKAYSG